MNLCDRLRDTPPVCDRINETLEAFARLSDACPYAHTKDADCHHPGQDFNCLVCAPCNCPYLLEDLPLKRKYE